MLSLGHWTFQTRIEGIAREQRDEIWLTFIFKTVTVLIDQVLKSGVASDRLRRSRSFLDISTKYLNTGRNHVRDTQYGIHHWSVGIAGLEGRASGAWFARWQMRRSQCYILSSWWGLGVLDNENEVIVGSWDIIMHSLQKRRKRKEKRWATGWQLFIGKFIPIEAKLSVPTVVTLCQRASVPATSVCVCVS